MSAYTPLISLTVFLCSILQVVDAQEQPAGHESAILANNRTFEAAFAARDAEAMANAFCEDGGFTADDGRIFEGREAIKTFVAEALRGPKGAKLKIQTESISELAPSVLLEKGTTTVERPNGQTAQAVFSAVHVKVGDSWKIRSLVETPVPEAAATEYLAELSWLIGSWEEADPENKLTVKSNYQWASGGNYISRNITVKREDESVLEGWQIIGWDPVEERIRSWTFDDAGGFSSGFWTREGDRWLLQDAGYSSDGSRTSSEQTITKVNDDLFHWESGNRTVEGEPRPSIGRIEIRRVKGN
jgi:uncharacterized protein (TIGR02246 family)